MSCNLKMKKYFDLKYNKIDLPWFEYSAKEDIIRIKDSPLKRISKVNTGGVAKRVAAAINADANNGPISIGDIAYVKFDDNGRGYVKIDPTPFQLKQIDKKVQIKEEFKNRENDLEVELALQERKKQDERDEIERIEQEYRDLGIDINTGESDLTQVGSAHRFPKAIIESNKEKFGTLHSERALDVLSVKADNVLKEGEESSPGETNRELLFGEKEIETNASKVIKNILNRKDDLAPEVSEVLNSMLSTLENTKATVRIVEQDKLQHEDAVMEYDANSNVIYISNQTLDAGNINGVAIAFMHEAIHSVTVSSMLNADTASKKIFSNFMSEMFAKYKDMDNSGMYGFSNAIEFVAEISSNPEFREHIKNLEGDNQSLWNRFIDNVRALLGLRKKSDFDKILNEIYEISYEEVFIGPDQSEYNMFAKKEDDNIKPPDLSSTSGKLTNSLDKILNRLERTVYEYDKLIKRDPESSSYVTHRAKASEIIAEVEHLYETDTVLAISKYADYASKQLASIEKSVKELEVMEGKDGFFVSELYKGYAGSLSIVKELQDTITSIIRNDKSGLDRDLLNEVNETLGHSIKSFNAISSNILSFDKQLTYNELIKPEYNTKVSKEWYERIGKDYEGDIANKEAWVIDQMETTYKEEIKADMELRVAMLLENAGFDIDSITAQIISAENTNNELIQNVKQILERVNVKIIEANRSLDFELKTEFEKFQTAKGSNLKPSTAYKNIMEKDSNGKYYIKGEYSIEFYNEIAKRKKEISENYEEGLDVTQLQTELMEWVSKNTTVETVTQEDGSLKSVQVPTSEWKNNLESLSEADKNLREFAIKKFQEADKKKFGIRSLNHSVYNATWISLPTVTKDRMERIVEGEAKGAAKDFIADLHSYRADQVDFKERKFDRENRPDQELRIHYRGNLKDPSQQSLDLFSLIAMEGKNANSFQAKSEIENNVSVILNIAKNKEYFNTSGDKYILNMFNKKDRFSTKRGEDSNVYKRLNDMIETNIYDIFRHDMGQVGSWDLNKMIDFATGWTANLGMGVNTISSSVNLLNGEVHMMLEAIGGHHIGFSNIRRAKARYTADFVNIMKDTYSPVKTSFTNQIMEMFDTEGNRGMSHEHRFVKSNAMRAKMNMGTLMTMQTAGEHLVQGTFTMALLDGIKVMNAESKWINKDGEVVNSMKEAATMLDMITKDKDGKLKISDKVVYTTHAPYLKMQEGGRELLNRYIKKKMKDTVGNYDVKDQGMLYKHGAGRLLLMFRRYLAPMFLAKFRGFKNIGKALEDMSAKDKFFSEALQEYDMGTYTAAARVVYRGLQHMIKEQKMSAFRNELSNMTAYEKAQARKGAAEAILIAAILPALSGLSAVIADENADGDDDFLWYVAATMTRLQTELQSFVDPVANWRILKSPTAAMGVFDNAGSFVFSLFAPWNWDEEYKTGSNAGENKLFIKSKRLLPVLNRRVLDYKSKYDYLKIGTYHIGGPDKE